MNTETQRVDSIEICLQHAANKGLCPKTAVAAYTGRRDAVAELIAQAEEAQIKLQGYALLLREHGLLGAADEAVSDASNMRAALARVGGAQ